LKNSPQIFCFEKNGIFQQPQAMSIGTTAMASRSRRLCGLVSSFIAKKLDINQQKAHI
jgi:hypothetical protein